MLEFEASFLAIDFPANNHDWSEEARHFEVLAQFISIPDLSVLGFECFTAAGLSIDLSDSLVAILSLIKHL